MTLSTYVNRIRDDRGSVGVLMALVIFVFLGSLCMTWNTVQLSKEKMRLQNAADAAALGYCTWQARGMNTIQNINDEMYIGLAMSKRLQTAASIFEGVAMGFETAGKFPITAWMRGLAIPFHVIAVLTGGTSGWITQRVCKFVLNPAGYFYAYGTVPLGYVSAQQFAMMNTADPVGNASLNLGGQFGSLGIFALGISFPVMDTLRLPLERKNTTESPWKHSNEALKKLCQGMTEPQPWRGIHKFCGTGEPWEFKPWISTPISGKEVGRTPGPCIFIAHKYYTHIETIPLDMWTKHDRNQENIRKMPMFAIAAAQCIAGDVVPCNDRKSAGVVNNRLAGFGTGATAKLVPITYALGQLNETVGMVLSPIFYH